MNFLFDLGITQPAVFCIAVLLLNLTPGPDTAFIVGQSVVHGRTAGLVAALGISAGCAVHTLALALGLSAAIAASPGAFSIVKVVGATYLIYLGIRMLVATVRAPAPPVAGVEMGPRPAPSIGRSCMQGFVTNVLNPKVILFFLSFIPQFVSETSTSKGLAFAVLGAVLILITTIYNGGVAWLAGGISRRMHGVPRVRRWVERVVGVAFIGLGLRLVAAHR